MVAGMVVAQTTADISGSAKTPCCTTLTKSVKFKETKKAYSTMISWISFFDLRLWDCEIVGL
jgi:hypothetical protein